MLKSTWVLVLPSVWSTKSWHRHTPTECRLYIPSLSISGTWLISVLHVTGLWPEGLLNAPRCGRIRLIDFGASCLIAWIYGVKLNYPSLICRELQGSHHLASESLAVRTYPLGPAAFLYLPDNRRISTLLALKGGF